MRPSWMPTAPFSIAPNGVPTAGSMVATWQSTSIRSHMARLLSSPSLLGEGDRTNVRWRGWNGPRASVRAKHELEVDRRPDRREWDRAGRFARRADGGGLGDSGSLRPGAGNDPADLAP